MKNLIVIIILSAFAIIGLNAQEMNKKSKDNFTVKVDGLGCAFCAYGLEKKFKELDGIKKIAIDLETGTLTFNLPSQQKLNLESVETQVNSAGYTFINAEVERFDGVIQHLEKNESSTETTKTLSFQAIKVSGNCGMCKARIEKTANGIEGIISAEWNEETKILMVEYDSATTDSAQIEAAIAKAGHDTENTLADRETYENLPACCLYDRK